MFYDKRNKDTEMNYNVTLYPYTTLLTLLSKLVLN